MKARLASLHVIHLALLIAVALVVARADLRMFQARGLASEAAIPIREAAEIAATGVWPRTAFYPPLVKWIALAIQAAGVDEIDPFIFNLGFLILGLIPAYAFARMVLPKSWFAFAACAAMLLNPYFVWTALLSRDTAAEFLFLGVVLWASARLCMEDSSTGAKWLAFTLVAAAICLSLARVTGYFMGLAVVCVAWLTSTEAGTKRLLAAGAAVLLIFGLLWAYANYRLVGAFTLATNGGYNLYLGNHPAFLHGYPHYDLDVFLRSQDSAALAEASEAESNAGYTRRALDFIRADPAEFLYRTIMKSAWFWFSLDKLPNYSSDSQITSPPSNEEWTAHLGSVGIASSLVYVLYRLAYLPALLASWIALRRRLLDRRWSVAFAPLLGLWPVLALTFPDTRFKIAAEVLTLPVVIAGAWALWAAARAETPNGPTSR